jgi:hypothetical protein
MAGVVEVLALRVIEVLALRVIAELMMYSEMIEIDTE